MAKSRNVRVVYPEDKEERTKDANNKLRAENRRLKKKIKQLQEDNKQLQRAFNKSCDYIDDKLSNKKLEDVINIVDNFKHKETERGRGKVILKQNENFESKKCPDCNSMVGEKFKVLDFTGFKVYSCSCGFRKRVNSSEGNTGS